MSWRQQEELEREQWETEAGWLAADREYLAWLESLPPWWKSIDSDEKWIKEHS